MVQLNVKQLLKQKGKSKYWLYNELNNVGTISYSNFNAMVEMKTKSMDAYIKKYELEFVGMSDREVIVYTDDKCEYSAGFKKD